MTPEIHPSEVLDKQDNGYLLIDVRSKEEYTGELGHIEGSKLVTLGPDLTDWLKEQDKGTKLVFICRSGGRSGMATEEAMSLGFKDCYNMNGGMILWNEIKN